MREEQHRARAGKLKMHFRSERIGGASGEHTTIYMLNQPDRITPLREQKRKSE
jgi:hypothetical protein